MENEEDMDTRYSHLFTPQGGNIKCKSFSCNKS